jgi:four helix bundle protein
MNNYKNIRVWKSSYELSLQIYEITKYFPDDERFGLTSQLRRAAVSIPINIAEGSGRSSKKDFAHFIQIAIGSTNEVECELMLAKDLHLISEDIFKEINVKLIKIRVMLFSFRNTLLNSN